MNEFIVWDKDNYYGEDNVFHELERFLDDGLCVAIEKDNGLVIIDYDVQDYCQPKVLNIETFNYIGLKDINDKKIYADCSIVEYGVQKWKVIYNVFQMCYELECISNKNFANMRLTGAYMGELKIIDTIQENKLGLIN